MKFKLGAFVCLDERIGVVVGIRRDFEDPHTDQLEVWLGAFENGQPEVWTIPAESLKEAQQPVYKN